MNNCLAIDTSSQQATIGLQIAGVYYHTQINHAKAQAEQLLKSIETLRVEAKTELKKINYIAIANGPGSFTGLRVGVSAAQALAYALDIPVVAVGSLQVLAQQTYREYGCEWVLVAQDARMQELYWGLFSLQDGLMQPVGDVEVAPLAVMMTRATALYSQNTAVGDNSSLLLSEEALGSEVTIISNALELYPSLSEKFKKTYDLQSQAIDLIQLGESMFNANQITSPKELTPLYIRNKVAEKQQK